MTASLPPALAVAVEVALADLVARGGPTDADWEEARALAVCAYLPGGDLRIPLGGGR